MQNKTYLTPREVQEIFLKNFYSSPLKANDILIQYKDVLNQINITNINN